MKVDEALFLSKGLLYSEAEGLGIFDFKDEGTARVLRDGDELKFVPERSAMHKKVLGLLNG